MVGAVQVFDVFQAIHVDVALCDIVFAALVQPVMEQGEVGFFHSIQCFELSPHPFPERPKPARNNPHRVSNPIFLNVFPHSLYLLVSFLKDIRLTGILFT